ncbi:MULTISPECIES: PfkB family carbohydrate kinase [unclassified Photobacterium]|nr:MULTISPECIES: PfkB family carbohydrate kinase [unclassified Photobacterium]PSV39541.1 ribokinase [Photobacterium sp. GB-27]PSV40843.1 ribokinase [Photobacterium sp. GB-210]PSV55154.1 ribokinase [Photobacterium sp. GB-1]
MVNLKTLNQVLPVAIIGAAFGDIILTIKKLPTSGGDEVAREQSKQIGGCAFNVARSLARLGIDIINGIPVGNGPWGEMTKRAMQQEGLVPLLHNHRVDNGWCLAMVEPDKERTFITVEGCEQYWCEDQLNQLDISNGSLVYVSGYELVDKESEPLKKWLLSLDPSVRIFVDFGPRFAEIDSVFITQLLAKKPILTINRDEFKMLVRNNEASIDDAKKFSDASGVSLIYRLDKHGAWVIEPMSEAINIPAHNVEVVDTIAAGDSHCGGVLAGLSSGWSLADAARLGNAVAAIVVSTEGANGAPTILELESFLLNKS